MLLSPFNSYRLPAILGGVVAPGLAGLERLMSQVAPRVVLATHDEDKHARGMIARLARVERFTEARLWDLPWLAPYYRATPDYLPFEVKSPGTVTAFRVRFRRYFRFHLCLGCRDLQRFFGCFSAPGKRESHFVTPRKNECVFRGKMNGHSF